MKDQELLSKFVESGDQEYISILYQRYMHLVYGSCLKYYKNASDAEDAVMDIYEKIVRKIPGSNVQYFKSWLFTVTRNHCLEQLRKKSNHAEKENQAHVMHYQEEFHPDDVDKDKEVDVLHECIEKLGRSQKQCVQLFYFQKLSYNEISTQLELTMGQVRSNIQNGRRNLRICMDENQHRIEQSS